MATSLTFVAFKHYLSHHTHGAILLRMPINHIRHVQPPKQESYRLRMNFFNHHPKCSAMVNVPLSQQNSIELNTKYIASDIAKSILRGN